MDAADSEGSGRSLALARPVLLEQPPPGYFPTRTTHAWLVEVKPGAATVIHEDPLHPGEKLCLHRMELEGARLTVPAAIDHETLLTKRVRQTHLELLENAAHTRLAAFETEEEARPSEQVCLRGLVVVHDQRTKASSWFWLHDPGDDDPILVGENWIPIGARATLQMVRPEGLSSRFEAIVLDARAGHPFGCTLRVRVDEIASGVTTGFPLPYLRGLPGS